MRVSSSIGGTATWYLLGCWRGHYHLPKHGAKAANSVGCVPSSWITPPSIELMIIGAETT
jgi:hypothetical protein